MSKQPKNHSQEIDLKPELKILEEELKSENPDIFKGVPQDKKIEILRQFSFSVKHKYHSGPLPDPETLAQYNGAITDGANRIMLMAEKQQEHRFKIETAVIKSQSNQSLLGQIFGLFIGLSGIASGTYLASIGESTVGGVIAGATVVSLVSIFVLGKKSQNKSLKE